MSTLTEENRTGVNQEAPYANRPVQYLTASSLMANKVFNRKDEKLGEIKDFMIDVTNGKIDYAIIEFGGFLGIGEKFFAVPFSLLELDTKNETFVLDQSKEVLEKAPGFDKDHWPKTNSHAFTPTYTYWGGFMGQNVGGGF